MHYIDSHTISSLTVDSLLDDLLAIMYRHAAVLLERQLRDDTNNGCKGRLDGWEYQEKLFN